MNYSSEQIKKHGKLIQEFLNRKEEDIFQYERISGGWVDVDDPIFAIKVSYRKKPQLTRKEITENWVKENNIKVMDKVLIGKEKTLGLVFVIYRNEIGVKVNGDIFNYDVECLEKVKGEHTYFSEEDWQLFLGKAVKDKGGRVKTIITCTKGDSIAFTDNSQIIEMTLQEAFDQLVFADGSVFGKIKE